MEIRCNYHITSWTLKKNISESFWVAITMERSTMLLIRVNHMVNPLSMAMFNSYMIFHFIYGIILPIDFHIFQDG